jgi:hypothetical protein
MAELNVWVVIKLTTEGILATPALTKFWELMKTLVMVLGSSQMLLGTSQP